MPGFKNLNRFRNVSDPQIMVTGLRSALLGHAGNSLDIQAPDRVLSREHFKISCRGINQVRIKVYNCPFSYEKHIENGEHYVNAYVHAHAEKACKVLCFSGGLTETKTISVIEGAITPEKQNVTVLEGMPYTVTCSSRCRAGFCQVAWTTNKGSVFVKTDQEYTIWSTPSYKDTQSHHLTVHSASSSADYQCLLISVTGTIIDSADQHVDVKEPDSSIVEMLIDYVKPYFKWSK